MAPDDTRSNRLGIRLTDDQYAHLQTLRDATGRSISDLVNRALTLLTLDQIPDWVPPDEEPTLALSDEVWQALVLDALQLIRQAADLQHRLITARHQQQPLQPRSLHRAVHRASTILSHLTRMLVALGNGHINHA